VNAVELAELRSLTPIFPASTRGFSLDSISRQNRRLERLPQGRVIKIYAERFIVRTTFCREMLSSEKPGSRAGKIGSSSLELGQFHRVHAASRSPSSSLPKRPRWSSVRDGVRAPGCRCADERPVARLGKQELPPASRGPFSGADRSGSSPDEAAACAPRHDVSAGRSIVGKDRPNRRVASLPSSKMKASGSTRVGSVDRLDMGSTISNFRVARRLLESTCPSHSGPSYHQCPSASAS